MKPIISNIENCNNFKSHFVIINNKHVGCLCLNHKKQTEEFIKNLE